MAPLIVIFTGMGFAVAEKLPVVSLHLSETKVPLAQTIQLEAM